MTQNPPTPLKPLVLVGCTASGKSDLAEALAARTGATLIAVDAMQVYRGMDIGTAKPDPPTRQKFNYQMLDVADPWESYSAARFTAAARPLVDAALAQNHPVILVAGTILYLRAVIEGLFEGPSADPHLRAALEAEAAEKGLPHLHAQLAEIDPLAATRIHHNDLRRVTRALEVFRLTGRRISDLQTQWNVEHPPINALFLGLRRPKEDLNRRINARVKTMVDAGLVEEVHRLHHHPKGLSEQAASAVGYRQVLDYFLGRHSLDDAIELIKIQTRHLAKLQRTWLKRFPQTTWLDAEESQPSTDLTPQALAVWTTAK